MDERKRRWILIKEGKEGIRGIRTTAKAQGVMDERTMTLKDGGVIAKGARVKAIGDKNVELSKM
jgi:hypothetical protein